MSSLNPVIDTLLIKVASRCNINCAYCYVYNMGDDNWLRLEKLISEDTIDSIASALKELVVYQSTPFSIVLHGGEPLLLGIEKLANLLRKLREVLSYSYTISIQTNGILITQQILDICFLYRVSLAVSIDGPAEVHNKFRVTKAGKETFDRVLAGIEKLKSHDHSDFLYDGVLAVVDPTSNPKDIYHFFKKLAPPSVDFLYKDGNNTNLPLHKTSIDSTEYGSWMIGLLNEYFNDPEPIRIRVLDDMIKVLLGGMVSKEGLGVTDFGILIIDTDGTLMKNDTLKSSFNGADKFELTQNIKEGNLIDFLNSTEFQKYRQIQRPTNEKCINCPVLNVCGGGMVLNRWSQENAFDNPSVYCADQLILINRIHQELAQYQF